ncbi:hypothetical protein [Shimazuella kribbensis]|uniref:hypothetical protein n=1 Tax=Shimazuella kribbensis TaxID=139808 RepID=UPI00041BE39C|nr:hypothetical protein [Shimazuella kribbensis]
MGKCTSKLITILQAVFRKLLVSFIIAFIIGAKGFISYYYGDSLISQYSLSSFGEDLFYWTYILFIIGGSTSLLSDLITWKLPLRRKRTVAAMIHLAPMFLYGSYYAFDMVLFFICLTVVFVFWIMDELIRFYQKNCDMCLKRVYSNFQLKKAT